jgi:DNA-binding protein HU-beta
MWALALSLMENCVQETMSKKTTGPFTMNKPMTKTQLTAKIADLVSTDRKAATAFLDALATIVTEEVAQGGSVTLPGIGKVACRARPERQVRNPATGETMTKAADRQVKVTILKALKDAIND